MAGRAVLWGDVPAGGHRQGLGAGLDQSGEGCTQPSHMGKLCLFNWFCKALIKASLSSVSSCVLYKIIS